MTHAAGGVAVRVVYLTVWKTRRFGPNLVCLRFRVLHPRGEDGGPRAFDDVIGAVSLGLLRDAAVQPPIKHFELLEQTKEWQTLSKELSLPWREQNER